MTLDLKAEVAADLLGRDAGPPVCIAAWTEPLCHKTTKPIDKRMRY